jgi:hypothetical protein
MSPTVLAFRAASAGRHFLGAALLVFAAVTVAEARPLSEAETAALAERVAAFDAAIRASDFEAVVSVIPPRVIDHFSESSGMSQEDLRATIVSQMDEVFAEVTLVSFGMDVAAAEHRELEDGTPFVFIPTDMTMDGGEAIGRVAIETQTLGMIDEGEWYLIRISDPSMVAVLQDVYPEFAGVEFPAETITALEE